MTAPDLVIRGGTAILPTGQRPVDIAVTGGINRAMALSFPVTASASSGILIDLVNQVGTAIISAIEITAANPNGVASPTLDLELSTNNGASWTPIANGQSVDRFGSGSLMWTPSDTTAGRTALIRATATGSQVVHDSSDDAFQIVDGTHDYYVNDATTTGDLFTTALGNNLNSGKSPSQPMATLAALLAAYDLGIGDQPYKFRLPAKTKNCQTWGLYPP